MLATSGNRVERWASMPLEAGLVDNGLVVDPPALGAALKGLMRFSGINASRVVTALSGHNAVFRVTTLPEVRERKAEPKIIYDAIKKLMPLEAEQLYMHWQTARNGGIRDKTFVTGMTRSAVDAHVKALKCAGISPHVMVLRGMALLGLVGCRDGLIVNMESDSLDVGLKKDGLPCVIRTLKQRSDMDLEERIDLLVRVLWQVRSFLESPQKGTLDVRLPLFLTGPLLEDRQTIVTVQRRVEHFVLPIMVPLDFSASLPVSEYAVNLGLVVPGPVIEYEIEGNGAGKERTSNGQ